VKISITSLLLGFSFSCVTHADDIRYVRDWMSVPLRATQAQDSAVVHRGLISGSKVTLLETDEKSGFSRVRSGDAEGWMGTRFLSGEPGARAQLEQAQAEITDLRKANEQLKTQQANLPTDQRQALQQITDMQAANEKLQNQITELKNAPDGTEHLHALQQRNEDLRAQFDKLSEQMQAAQSGRDNEMFRNGALAVIAGALLTLIIPRLWPRKRKSDWA
jgi:SH3 domain protein